MSIIRSGEFDVDLESGDYVLREVGSYVYVSPAVPDVYVAEMARRTALDVIPCGTPKSWSLSQMTDLFDPDRTCQGLAIQVLVPANLVAEVDANAPKLYGDGDPSL